MGLHPSKLAALLSQFSATSASGGEAAPTLTGAPTLVASWDPGNTASRTLDGANVSAIAGVDGTSFTLENTGSARPTLETYRGKPALRFTSASSQFLRYAGGMGITAPCTLVVIGECATTDVNMNFLDVAQGASATTANRHTLNAISGATGFQYRKGSDAAAVGSAYGAQPVVLIGTSPSGSAVASLYVDASTAYVSAAGTFVGTPDVTSMGCRRSNSSTNDLFLNGWVWRALVYSAVLDATQLSEVNAWASTNYGTH